MTDEATDNRPLAGVRVLELGQLIAGPHAGSMLAYFGAEVMKVETPGKGDPIRHWRALDKEGTSWWWRSVGRNKKSITINLKSDKGREIVRDLMLQSDVVLENFRPGTLEKWGLGPDEIRREKPDLIFSRVSGYGQTGPRSQRPGYASACEAYGGFRYVNGFADRPPVRPNLSLGDTLAGMHSVIGVLLALLSRGKTGNGQVVDVSIFESVFNVMEAVVPEYSGGGLVREPSGSTITGIVPTNTYQCSDGKYVVIGGNGDSIYRRLMKTAGREDLADDPRLSDNIGRVEHEQEIDKAIGEWTSSVTSQQVLDALEEAEVPSGPIYSVADMFEDEHYQARGLFEPVPGDSEDVVVPAFHPKLTETPGRTDTGGPALGEHTEQILAQLLNLDSDAIAALRVDGVI
jgi:crotonobetainyl-CoA:carnitine CoA-transferase CaiB-like acyl-CoA transferase